MPAEIIRLNSTGKNRKGKKTGYFKTTKINKKNRLPGAGKLRLKCYDPRAYNQATGTYGMHVWFEEGKIK